jgi:hypothetical protein
MIPSSEATVLFADICQSSELYAAHGDAVAYSYIHKTLTALADIAQDHHGRIVKNLGDGLLCVFETPANAVHAACAMQSAVSAPEFLPDNPINIRIGVHVGKVIREADDVYGDTVNLAARAMTLAGERQIMATNELIEQLDDEHVLARYFGRFNIKGKDEKIAFQEILWQDDLANITIVSKISLHSRSQAMYAEITFEGQTFVLDRQFPLLKIGRQALNNIVIPQPYVSKNHAVILHKNGKFIISDTSSNGTFLRMEDGARLFIHHDETALLGAGSIFCGKDVGLNPDEIISYKIRSE